MIRTAFLAAFFTVLSVAVRDAQAGLLFRRLGPRDAFCQGVQSCCVGRDSRAAGDCLSVVEFCCEPFGHEDACCSGDDCGDGDEDCGNTDCCCDCDLCRAGCCCMLDRGCGHGGVVGGQGDAGHHGAGLLGRSHHWGSGFQYPFGGEVFSGGDSGGGGFDGGGFDGGGFDGGGFDGGGFGGGGFGGGGFGGPVYSGEAYLSDGPDGGGLGGDEPSETDNYPPDFPPDSPPDLLLELPPDFPPDLPAVGPGDGRGPDGDTSDEPTSTHNPEPGTAAIWSGLCLIALLWAARRNHRRSPDPA